MLHSLDILNNPFLTGRGTKPDVRGPIRHKVQEVVLLGLMVAIFILLKPLVVGTPKLKLKLIVRVEQEKRRHSSSSSSPSSDYSSSSNDSKSSFPEVGLRVH